MYVLEVLSGPLDGKSWSFESEIIIGRDDSSAQACLTLDRYVSRRHARVHADDDGLMLEDLESRNGTKLDGNAVHAELPLPVGAPFIVGRTVLRVTRV